MKISGEEFWRWHEEAWPAGHYWAEDSVLDDGRQIYREDATGGCLGLALDPEEVFVIPSGWFVRSDRDGKFVSIRTLIRRWRKDQATATLVVEVPRAQAEAARLELVGRGWKVTGA